MKKADLMFGAVFIAIFLPFFVSDRLYDFFLWFSREWAYLASFIKFALLATMGEMLGSRIRSGKYIAPGFGLVPRAFIWGFLGITVKAAFVIFAGGVPLMAAHFGMADPVGVMARGLTTQKVMLSFGISLFLNIFYAPVLMVTHRVTDMHIVSSNGDRSKLLMMPDVQTLLGLIDWKSMWGFVLKKTIPFFWIPAQTVTFLLPPEFQVLFAAILSTVLGVILAFSAGSVRR
jgi:hypothetical protein